MIKDHKKGTTIELSVRPSSNKGSVEIRGHRLIVWIKAPPKEGKANRELVKTLSDLFKVEKDRIKVLIGHHLRKKVVLLENISKDEVERKLKQFR